MNVFIIWSGDTSQAIAEALRDWLPQVIQAVKPWISTKDIEKGAHWPTKLAQALKKVNFGIVCLTSHNLNNSWILFESGATSNAVGETLVSPYLFGLNTTDVTPPLSHFQMSKADKEDTLKLMQSINLALGERALKEDILQQAFNKWWPDFEQKLDKIKTESKKEVTETEPRRSDSEKLDDILNEVRQISRIPTFSQSVPHTTTYTWESQYPPPKNIIHPAGSATYEYMYTGKEPDFVVMTPSGLKGFRSGLPVEITEVKEESDKKKKK